MPDKPRIINLEDARRKQQGDPTLAERLAWIEELEDALETLTRAGVTTRAELEALLAELEALLAELEANIPPDGK